MVKRGAALMSLSHDHHQALLVALKLTRATPQTRTEALSALNAYWSSDGRAHFRVEEEILFPAYARHADPLLAKALCQHAAIRQRIDALDGTATQDPSTLPELGFLIREHVRFEERELFPRIEALLPAAELAALADALAHAPDRQTD